ncbi:biopolymer transporter ExbD [Candidatus Poribacteria bacterium]|nr:MAG: biopolymer transporter ExbD [Candidatus Poribacteria bacterium]
MRRFWRSKSDEEWEINITPMLDIVFILLIFFIVTTVFVQKPGIEPLRPWAETAVVQERGNILIAVSNTDEIWMNNNRVTLQSIRYLVEAAKLETPESSVVIVADQTASTGMLLDVMDNVRSAGVANISLAAENPLEQ